MALGFFIFNPQTKRVTHLRIGISGASGFIGQKLLHNFIEQGHHVAVLSRDSRQFKKHPQIEVFEVDLTQPDQSTIAQFVRGLDLFYHLAAELNDSQRIITTNVGGTKVIIDALIGSKTRAVFLSSIGIFQFSKNTVILENSPKAARNLYEESKLAAEELIFTAQKESGLNAVILRPSIVLGEQMKTNLLLQLIRLIKKGIQLKASKNTYSNFVLATDLINALILVGQHPKAIGEAYNFSNDLSLNKLLYMIEKQLDSGIYLRLPIALFQGLLQLLSFFKLTQISKEGIAFFSHSSQISSEKIQRELGFEFTQDYQPFLEEYVNCNR